MNAILSYPVISIIFAVLIILQHRLSGIAGDKKWILPITNLITHISMIVFMLIIGASLPELLLMLLISAAAAVA